MPITMRHFSVDLIIVFHPCSFGGLAPEKPKECLKTFNRLLGIAVINVSCYLEIQLRWKTPFCRELHGFSRIGKKSVQISEIRGKGFGFLDMVAAWVNYCFSGGV